MGRAAILAGQRGFLGRPEIKASLAATGIDWMGVGDDGYWRPDVRTQFVTDDGAVILRVTQGSSSRPTASRRPPKPMSQPSGPISTCG